MKRSVFLPLSLLLVGCWGQDNPLDPARCDPACGAGHRCIDGRCVAPDTGAADLHRDRTTKDMQRRDKPLSPADLKKPKPDTIQQPDLQQPPDLIAQGAGCTDGTIEQVFTQRMVGCAGKVSWSSRATLCRGGSRVCTAKEWVARWGNIKPTYSYWTDDDLRYIGLGGACYVMLNWGSTCPGQPMRVCAGNKDPLGNLCNWIGCGFQKVSPNLHFGGCKNNPSAGAICCPK